MSLIKIDHNPKRSTLNRFGIFWLIFFSIIGGVLLWKAPAYINVSYGLWVAAVIVPVIGWIFPGFMRIVYLVLTYITFPIGFVVSYIVFGMIFYLLFTPVGWIMKLVGYDPMHRKFEKDKESYWVTHEQPAKMRRYFKQY